jgi:DNA-binding protein Fis
MPRARAGNRRTRIVARAIEQAQGNQAKAARWLGISRITMKAKLVQFGIHSP